MESRSVRAARLREAKAFILKNLERRDLTVSSVAARLGGRAFEVDLAADFDAAALAGQADILVNCAGLQHVAPVHEFPPDKFRLLLAVMLEAPFRLAQAALPHMYARGFGRIVNISSVHGLRASPYKAAYVAAKHGLEGLSKVIALEGGERGVTSNTVCPAFVRTPLVEKQIADQRPSPTARPGSSTEAGQPANTKPRCASPHERQPWRPSQMSPRTPPVRRPGGSRRLRCGVPRAGR